jgi:hypothetical protein
MDLDIEQLYREMLDRLPQYERARAVQVAYLDVIEKSGGLFLFRPIVDGKPGDLSEAVEERCKMAVAKELRKCIKEIDEHLQRVRSIPVKKA